MFLCRSKEHVQRQLTTTLQTQKFHSNELIVPNLVPTYLNKIHIYILNKIELNGGSEIRVFDVFLEQGRM